MIQKINNNLKNISQTKIQNKLKFISEFKQKKDILKPREKLEKFGSESLQLWELLAIILRTGEKHKGGFFEDVEQLSKRLLAEAGFKGIFQQKSVTDLQENHNIYKSHSEILVAISEISRRIHGKYESFDVSTPDKIFEKFKFLQKAKQEQCFVLHVDKNNKCIFQELIGLGAGNSVQVSFSDVLRSVLWLGAKKIIIVHNHPNIKSRPSESDIHWTLSLAKGASQFHDISLMDHVIVGDDGYFSFLENGII